MRNKTWKVKIEELNVPYSLVYCSIIVVIAHHQDNMEYNPFIDDHPSPHFSDFTGTNMRLRGL